MTIVLPDRLIQLPSVLTVSSPLTHAEETIETTQLFRREPVVQPDGQTVDVPIYSGNALRGMLRRATALRICDTLRFDDRSLPPLAFYLLFSGGYLDGSDWAHRTLEVQRLRTLLPSIALLGASWGARIIHGRLQVWRGEPVCLEMAHLPGHEGHDAYSDGEVLSAHELLTEIAYTRRDDRAEQLGDDQSPVQMRYQAEALVPGTRLIHGLTVQTRDPLMLGALVDAIRTCEAAQSLGGRSAIGHGRFAWTLGGQVDGDEWDQHRSEYIAHLASNRDEIADLLGVVS